MALNPRSATRQAGLTLVELMVALSLGLVVSLAAASLYLVSRGTASTAQAISGIGETGQLALDLIGREIQKAGFYPAQFPTDAATPNIVGRFTNTKNAAKPAFNQGLFGCEGAAYNPATMACGATVAGAPDSLVLNYFATPEFGDDSLIGIARDCNRKKVSADAANAARALAKLPLMVSNRFMLLDTAYTAPDGQAVRTRSLGCHGNGAEAEAQAAPILQGVEDMVLTYGVYSGVNSQTADRYYSASQVAALPLVGDLGAWQRVTAVRVCLIVRSLERARLEEKAGTERSYANCRGATVTLSNADRAIYKRFDRVYAVRNNLTGTL